MEATETLTRQSKVGRMKHTKKETLMRLWFEVFVFVAH